MLMFIKIFLGMATEQLLPWIKFSSRFDLFSIHLPIE